MNSGEFWRKLLFPFRKRQFDRDLEEEMRFHLDMRARESGAPAAHKRFGSVALVQEDSRQAWGWTAVEQWASDLKYAARALRRNPGFTAVAVLTMALGIGACTAVFSVVHAVLLRPLPFGDPARIMAVWARFDRSPDKKTVVSHPIYRDWKDHAPSFTGMAIWNRDAVRTTVRGEPEQILAGRVTGDFFRVLGVQPMLGRTFVPDEERSVAQPVTVLSWALWQRLGGDPAMIGKPVHFDREVFTVVGVMPRRFSFPADAELWLPFAADKAYGEGTYNYRVIGRLKPGASASQAQSEADAIARRHSADVGAWVVPLRDQLVGDARPALLILAGAVGCVLLIACANLAGLLLARVTARRRELSLRLSLGAGRWRLARCVLAESVLLAVGGAAIGVVAARVLVRAFVALDPIHLPRIAEVAVSPAVLLSALAAAIATGVLFGLGPALRAGRPQPAEVHANRARSVLAAAQMALAVTLLIGAGLLLRSFVLRVSVPLGFRPEGVLGVELPWSVNPRIDEILDRLRVLPGVQSVGAATAFPQDRAGTSCDSCLEIEGQPKADKPPRPVGLMVATHGFFGATGIPLLRGRFFTAADAPEAPKVAILSEALARRDFAGRDPIGARVRWGGDWATVVGIVGNVKGFGVAGDPMPAVYFPRGQHQWGNPPQVVVQTAVPPAALAATVKKEIRAWNPRLLMKLDTVENMLAEQVAVPRFYVSLLTGFAALALIVAGVGVYGTVNYAVARRTHEIGIRMALGAERRDVLAIVFRQGFELTASGLAIGLVGAWFSTRALQTLLFGVRPTDPAAFACGASVLVLAVLIACYFPARRAARVNPVEALRQE